MKCPQCGVNLSHDAEFCGVCGLDIAYIRKNDPDLYRKMLASDRPPVRPVQPVAPPPPPVPKKSNPLILVVVLLCVAVMVGTVIGVVVTNLNADSGSAQGSTNKPGQPTQSNQPTLPTDENMVLVMNVAYMDYTVDSEDYSLQITYSEYGQPLYGSIVYDGKNYNYFKMEWNEDGYLVGEYYYELNGNDTVSEYYQYTYDDAGNVLRIDYLQNQEKGYNVFYYDENGKKIGLMMYTADGTLIETQTYAYSGDNQVSEYYVNGAGDTWILLEHRYNEDNYLYETIKTDSSGYYERIEYTMLDSDTEQKYRYDASGNILGYTAWEYDQNHNLISQREYDGNYVEVNVYEYSYNDQGKMTRRFISVNGETDERIYTYDSLGNLMSMAQDETFADGTASHTDFSYTFTTLAVPRDMAEKLKACIETSELNPMFVNIVG